jgi:hypothetical protein
MRIAILFSEAIGTPITEIARSDIETLLLLAGASIPPVRLDAFRGNWAIDWFVQFDIEYWRVNRLWMTQVRDARLLGCCQLSQTDCYQRMFP